MLTQSELQKNFTYCTKTGHLIRKSDNKVLNSTNRGYCVVKINKKQYLVHRLIWLYVYGKWPSCQIDHIDGNRSNNNINNLREVSIQGNGRNRIEHRNGHLLGTTYRKDLKKWYSQIQIEKKKVFLGSYNTQQEAHKAYLEKLQEITK